MEPVSLKRFLQDPSLRASAEKALSLSKDINLVPIVSFYLEDDLLKKLVNSLEGTLEGVYDRFKNDRGAFVKEACKRLGAEERDAVHFPYYAVPVSETTKVNFVENNVVPPKAVVREGSFRLTFLPYESYNLMEDEVRRQGEDDIVVEFKDGVVQRMEKKRNIFIENKSVEALTKGQVVVNLIVPSLTLFSAVVAMNVHPWENEVEIRRVQEEVELKVNKGLAEPSEVMNGKTLLPKTKAEIYYDFKRRNVFPEQIISAIAAKFTD